MKEQDFIQKICGYAISDMKENGILASVTIAQAILESSWGTSELAKKANNYFGMKCSLSSNSWGSVWDRVSKSQTSRMRPEKFILSKRILGHIQT